MIKKIFILILIFFQITLGQNVLANEITISDIRNSDEFLKRKGEIVYSQVGDKNIRDVFINGFRMNDYQLVVFVKDKELINKLDELLFSKRLLWGSIAILGLPVGFVLSYNAMSKYSKSEQVLYGGEYYYIGVSDPAIFIMGTLGTILIMFGIIYSMMFINDISGLEFQQVLKDDEVEQIIKKYNESLEKELLNKYNKTSR